MRSFTIDTRMFEQPGFEMMFQAWSDAFEVDDFGKSKLEAEEALLRTATARKEAEMITGLESGVLNTLEQIACRYAQVMPVFVEERLCV